MPDGSKAYVPGSGAVHVLDLDTNTLAGTIPVDRNAYAVAAPDNSAVYVTQRPSSGPGLVRTIDPSSDTLVTPAITVGSDPFSIEIDPSGSELYVADANGSFWFVDIGTGSIITSISAPADVASRWTGHPTGLRSFCRATRLPECLPRSTPRRGPCRPRRLWVPIPWAWPCAGDEEDRRRGAGSMPRLREG